MYYTYHKHSCCIILVRKNVQKMSVYIQYLKYFLLQLVGFVGQKLQIEREDWISALSFLCTASLSSILVLSLLCAQWPIQ